ncbi:Hypothetical predicted protein [Olea europaea subsp. europaea]|uniref:Uncharacterized protein n=1 Tax=Olea europaea subsp. europaea TaxID=158383 RepID=A0A8S0RE66_OLEEU|nr:Hypothetical predicted protein [Olea europaea subsp. europaea]
MAMSYMTEVRWKGPSVDGDSISRKRKSTDTTDPHTLDSEGQPSNNATNVEKSVDSKGKGKVDSMGEVEFPCSLEHPSFNLGLGFTQPSQLEAMTSKEAQVHVDSIISNVLKEMESPEQEGVVAEYFDHMSHKSLHNSHTVFTHVWFKDDAIVVVTDERLIDDITSARIPLSTS